MSPERDVTFCKDIVRLDGFERFNMFNWMQPFEHLEPFEPLIPTVHFKQKLS